CAALGAGCAAPGCAIERATSCVDGVAGESPRWWLGQFGPGAVWEMSVAGGARSSALSRLASDAREPIGLDNKATIFWMQLTKLFIIIFRVLRLQFTVNTSISRVPLKFHFAVQ